MVAARVRVIARVELGFRVGLIGELIARGY
jgi:hypothetical protein